MTSREEPEPGTLSQADKADQDVPGRSYVSVSVAEWRNDGRELSSAWGNEHPRSLDYLFCHLVIVVDTHLTHKPQIKMIFKQRQTNV